MRKLVLVDNPSKPKILRLRLRCPPNPEEARELLINIRDYAKAALILLDLDDHDVDAWARDGWDELSPDALVALDVLMITEPTGYRDALDVIDNELRLLMLDAPSPHRGRLSGE